MFRRPIAVLFTAALVASFLVRVDFEAYDGCNDITGDEPALVVPISLVLDRPLLDSSSATERGCVADGERWFEVRG